MKDMKNEIIEMSVCSLVSALKSRKINAAEVTDAYLNRINETEPELNAYITVTEKAALAGASLADEMIKNCTGGSLCGVPFAIKDNIAISGVPMTCASEMLRGFIPCYTATAVEKVTSGGGILLGKTNMDEFAMGSSCEKSVFGAVHNPLDTKRSAGGSSGGSAASVAAHSAPWALATDTGGSARQPASFCGVVAMKPTYGLVSRYGVVAFASSLDTLCPVTRDVSDNAAVLSAIAGHDRRDMTSSRVPHKDYQDSITRGVNGMNFCVPPGVRDLCETGVSVSLDRAVSMLERLGARVDYLGDGEIPSFDTMLDVYIVTASSECSSNLARFDGIRYGYTETSPDYGTIMKKSRSSGFGDEVRRRIIAGTYALSSSYGGGCYTKAKDIRAHITETVDVILSRYDAVILPTTSGVTFPLGTFNDDPTSLYASDKFAVMANLTGCPALTLPCGGDDGLPHGLMIMGRRFSEDVIYRAAYALEDALAGYVREEVATPAFSL